MIEYHSNERVNDLYFGDSPEKAIEVFGEPKRKIKDREGNLVFMYDDYTISFDKNNKFFYFALHPGVDATINGTKVGWNIDKIKPIIQMDRNPVEDVGFIILRDLGVAFDNFYTPDDEESDKVIVFFRPGEFKQNKTTEKPIKLT